MTVPRLISVDCETHLIGAGALAPKLVCTTAAWRDPATGVIQRKGWGNDPAGLEEQRKFLVDALTAPDTMLVGARLRFDALVTSRQFPELFPLWAAKAKSQQLWDVQIANKLRMLSSSGDVNSRVLADGSRETVQHNLAALERTYLGRDRSEQKTPGSWRQNYSLLDGVPFDSYPEEASRYALEDVDGPLLIAEAQRATLGAARNRCDGTEKYSEVDFWLQVLAVQGMRVDQERFEEIRQQVSDLRAPENLPALIGGGYVTPAQPPRPYANGAIDKATGEPKMTAGTSEKLSRGRVKLHILMQSMAHEVPLRLTDKGKKAFAKDTLEMADVERFLDRNADVVNDKLAEKEKPKVRKRRDPEGGFREEIVSEDTLDPKEREFRQWCQEKGHPFHAMFELSAFVSTSADAVRSVAVQSGCPVLEEFERRQAVDKLVTTVLPNVERAFSQEAAAAGAWGIAHATIEVPVATGRMASRVDKLVPGFPAHQMPGGLAGIDPRTMLTARPGNLLIDCDITSLELGTTGHVTAEMFEDSGVVPCIHAKLLRDGVDLHSYLGAQIALKKDPKAGEYIQANAKSTAPLDQWRAFLGLKTSDDEADRKLFKHYRTMAKPVGLGFIGGLGAKTFVDFAAATYGVKVTLAEAKEFKALWLRTYTEMKPAFDRITSTMQDSDTPRRPAQEGDSLYQYVNGVGALRVGAFYTAATNGVLMQSPGAALFGDWFIRASEECYLDASSPLFGSRVLIVLHDQLVIETPATSWEAVRAAAARVEELLKQAGAEHCPRVPWGGEAALSHVWSKSVEPCFDDDGNLIVWTPDEPSESLTL